MNGAALLLANPSPNLRLLALRELVPNPAEDEIRELEAVRGEDGLVKNLVAEQNEDGSWSAVNPLHSTAGNPIVMTSLALARLGYFGFDKGFAAVRKGAAYLFSLQKKDGSWPFRKTDDETEGYSMVPLQTSLPLEGLSACGYAGDARSTKAYEWLLAKRLEDGAWPTGIASGVYGKVAGYRRIAHSRWGCRTNTTSALVCLSRHPELKGSKEAGRGLDLLLGRDTKEAYCLGYCVARMLGFEPVRGFFTYYARNDLALMLDLCARTGASTEDGMIASLAEFVVKLKSGYGIWKYGANNLASAWISFDILRSLSRLKHEGGFTTDEPETPFKAYYGKKKRY